MGKNTIIIAMASFAARTFLMWAIKTMF